MPGRRPALLLPALAFTTLIASGTFLVAKSTVAEFPPLTLAFFRFVLAAVVLWPVVRLLNRERRIASKDRARIWLLGLLGVTLNQGLYLYGMKWASASHAALLYALTPAFVALIGMRPRRGAPADSAAGPRVWAGIALAFAGVLTLLLQRGLHFDPHSVRGDLVILVAVVAWALYLVAGRGPTREYGPLLVTAEALLAGAILYIPVGLLSLRGFDPAAVSASGWLGLLYLALLTSVVNYVIWFWGLQYLKASTVALLTNVQPVVAAAMAWAILHEPLPAGFLLSSILVLGGVWIAQRAPAPPPAPRPV